MQQAQAAYSSGAQPIRTPRGTEYEAFVKITRQLKSAGSKKRNFRDLATAIHNNRRLWTLLACDVADGSNPLPPELRARVLFLAEFTRQHSSKVLRTGAPIEPLIEINLIVMRGLQDRRRMK